MALLDQSQEPGGRASFEEDLVHRQRRQMLIAFALLLAALVVVVTRDREFWFPPAPVQVESEPVEQVQPEQKAESTTATSTPQAPVPAAPKAKSHPAPAQSNPTTAPVVTGRTVLPSLEVEVVTGDQHKTVQSDSNSVKVDMGTKTSSPAAEASAAQPTPSLPGATNASTKVRLSPGAAQRLSRSVEPKYPLLAKEMKIQGAVVLEALIGRDGIIQHLRLLSGPAILSAAAREAVKQWRFRPYLQSGQPVETQARIIVSFNIWTQ